MTTKKILSSLVRNPLYRKNYN